MSKSIKGYLLLAVVLCSVFANLFVNYAETHAATDPATLYIAPEVQKDATASLYRAGIALCMTNQGGYDLTSGNNSDEITPGDAASGKWFYGGDYYEVRPGILVWDKAHDYIDCSTFISNHPAAAAFGFSDNIALACGVGLVRKDGKDCLNDPDQSNFTSKNIGGDKNKVYAALDSHYKNASAPPTGGENDAQRYVIVAKTFTDYCQATPKANVGGPKATPAIQAQYKDNKVNVVDGNGEVTSVYFDIPDGGKKAYLGNDAGDFSWWEQSCSELVGFMNKYSGAYATYVKAHPQSQAPTAPTTNPNNSGNDSPPTCSISGIGWIVCPVMRFMSQVTDQAYGIVSDMLTTPAVSTDTGSTMYKAWSTMRNFANVAFVIAFLIIIYAQITGFGVTNYGIKKLLPRIIIAAILVNVSYWICAIAVDASNILGSSLKGLLEGAGKQLYVGGQEFSKTGNPGWDNLTVGIIATTAGVAVLYAGLSVLAPILLMALLAIITVVIVLTARQALIILLIVVSPLAFVAYLLPNTESWFKKWRELFTSLLMMFPIIAVVFGACSLASNILMEPSNTQGGDGFMVTILKIMAAGVTVIPLAITPILMKTTTGVLGKIGGYVNNPNKGPFDRMRKGAAGYRQNRQEYRKLKSMTGYRSLPGRGIVARRGAQREAVLANRKSELNRAKTGYLADLAAGDAGFRGRLSQGGIEGGDERALAQAISVRAKLQADEVNAANAIIKNANLSSDISKLQELSLKGETTYVDQAGKTQTLKGAALQTAAIQQQFKIGDVGKTDELVANSAGMGVEQRQAIAEGMAGLSGKVKYYGGGAGNAVAQGQIKSETDLNKLVASTINDGKYSAEILAGSDKDALARIADVAADPDGTTSQKDAAGNIIAGTATALKSTRVDELKDAVAEIAAKDTIKNPDTRSQERLDAISHGVRYNP